LTQVDPQGDPVGEELELFPGYSFKPVALYVADSDGSDVTPLITGDHWLIMNAPSMSPDGSEIAFMGVTDSFDIEMVKVNTTTGIVTELSNYSWDTDYADGHPDWSPDGELISYLRMPNDPQADGQQIAVMDADGTNRHTLETLPVGTETFGPSFRQASTYPSPGPGPFPDILVPEAAQAAQQMRTERSSESGPKAAALANRGRLTAERGDYGGTTEAIDRKVRRLVAQISRRAGDRKAARPER